MNTTIYILAMAVCAFAIVGGCSEQTGMDSEAKSDGRCDVQSEDAVKARDRLFGALRMHQSGGHKFASEEDIDVLLQGVSSLTNKLERDAIFAEFEDRLFSFDPSELNYGQQRHVIAVTWHTSFLLRCAIRDATSRRLWEIRLKALAWVKHQIERIEKDDLETKWENAQAKEDRKRSGLQPLKTPIQESFNGYIKRCATDIEYYRYSDEFRKWAQKEMEKIIGRPLTDDDLWSIGIEWREERKKRAQKVGGSEKQRGVQ